MRKIVSIKNSLNEIKNSVNKGQKNYNIKSYANTASELGGSNSIVGGFTYRLCVFSE